MARGVDSHTAHRLREAGLTLARLMEMRKPDLLSLGLDQNTIKRLQKGRSSIPSPNLIGVLFANRFLCCVCRDDSKPIAVHHIEPWSESRDHSVSNLAVLCTHHHGEAHSTRALEQTLTPTLLKQLKREWESKVKRIDPIAIQKASQIQSDQWLYFNHLRIFELANDNAIELVDIPGFTQAKNAGVIDSEGNVTKGAEGGSFIYRDADGRPLYRYVKGVLTEVLAQAIPRNVSDHLDRSVMRALIVPNDIIYVQGLHRFKALEERPQGCQLMEGVRSANNVKVRFVFDRAEATSMSAWSIWLTGQNSVGSLIQVRKLERQDGRLEITGTALAIRNNADGAKERMYELSLYKSGIPQRRELEHDNDFSNLESGFDE